MLSDHVSSTMSSHEAIGGIVNRRLLAGPVILAVAIGAVATHVVAQGATSNSAAPAPKQSRLCTKYASTTGSDGNPGTWRRPVRTVSRLARSLRRDQVGCLRAGDYDVSRGLLTLRTAGITIRSFPGERARIRGNIEVDDRASGVRLSHLAIEGVGGQNTIQVFAANFVLTDSDVTNAWRGRSCVILGVKGATAFRPVIRRNRFHECGIRDDKLTHGIYVAHAADGAIKANVFWNIAAYAIQLYPDAQRMTVAYNVVDARQSSNGGVIVGGDDDEASSNNVIERNVIAYAKVNVSEYWESAVGTGNVARFNCLFGGRSREISAGRGLAEQGNVQADPLFRDAAVGDYRLGAGSGCVALVGANSAAPLRGRQLP
jgi:hypothetical protein